MQHDRQLVLFSPRAQALSSVFLSCYMRPNPIPVDRQLSRKMANGQTTHRVEGKLLDKQGDVLNLTGNLRNAR